MDDKSFEDEYYTDIFENWVNEDLGISYRNACDLKDYTTFTSDQVKVMAHQYRTAGRRGSPVIYILDEYERQQNEARQQALTQEMRWYKKEEPYMIGDFI